MQVTMRHVAVAATILLIPATHAVNAQVMTSRPRIGGDAQIVRVPGGAYSVMVGGENRAVIGVTLSGNGKLDTLGVLIDNVTTDSPAAKAGIKEGDRVVSINGINARVSAVDVDDPEMQNVGIRRITRELGKVKPGDEVELRVSTGTAQRTVRVKTVSAADLNHAEVRGSYSTTVRDDFEKRAALGVSLGSSGSVRDTLGLFISSVTTDGPAEKAGIVEGDRIASINGIDVRVPKEDAEDRSTATARINRFTRELQKLAPGDKANLRVYSNGRYREVAVTAAKASDLRNGFNFNFGDGNMVFSLPRGGAGGSSGSITLPGRTPQVYQYNGGNGGVMLNGEGLRFDNEALEKAMTEMRSRMEGLRQRLNDDRIESLPNGGVRIRSRAPSVEIPMVQPRTMTRRVTARA